MSLIQMNTMTFPRERGHSRAGAYASGQRGRHVLKVLQTLTRHGVILTKPRSHELHISETALPTSFCALQMLSLNSYQIGYNAASLVLSPILSANECTKSAL